MLNSDWTRIILLGVLLTFSWAPTQAEQGESSIASPLARFEPLIGGQWHLGDSYQEFEWGVGRLSVKARSYFIVDGRARLASEGIWFWQPAERTIKGVFTAIEMPVELFEYSTRFEGTDMISDLVTYSGNGDKTEYMERWVFLDDTHFEWTLYSVTTDGPRKEMGGIYSRKPSANSAPNLN
jgi:hypothetical protein